MRSSALFLAFLAAVLCYPSCRRGTEEDDVLGTVDSLARLAEKKDIESMMACFAEDFSDFEGRDKSGLRSLVSSYFTGRTGIVAHKLSSRIIDFRPGKASLEADVALSSGGAQALRRLIRISPDVYRIRVDLTKSEEDWLISYAEWASIGLSDLFPESLLQLRELFPGTQVEK